MESKLIVKIEGAEAERDAKRLAAALDKLGTEGEEAAKATDKVGNSSKRSAGSLSRMKSALGLASKALTGLVAGAGAVSLATSKITAMTDAVASMKGQLRLATGSQEAANEAFGRMLELANSTGQSLQATTSLYARMARATEELGVGQDDLLKVTKAINQSFIVSGSTAQEAGSAMLQLSQGIASGTLRGEELNAVLENSPRLAQAMAEGLGVTRGALKEMGAAGTLTAKELIEALTLMSDSIEEDFNQMPMTVGRAMQTLKNNVLAAFEDVDVSGLTGSLAEVSESLQDPDFKAAVTGLASSFVAMTANIVTFLAKYAEFSREVGETFARVFGGPGGEATVEGWIKRYNRLNDEFEFMLKNGHANSKGMKALQAEMKHLEAIMQVEGDTLEFQNGQWVLRKQVIEDNNAQSEEMTELLARGQKAHKLLADAIQYGDVVLKRYTQRTEELQEANQEYVEGLEDELDMLKMTDRERHMAVALKGLDAEASDELKLKTVQLAAAIWDEQQAIRAQEEALKSATEAANPWMDAMVHAVERIDEAFANLWVSALKGFDDFRASLTAAFRQLIAELAHTAITKPILLNIAAGFGIGGSSMASAAAASPSIFSNIGAAGGVLPWLSGGVSGIGTSAMNMLTRFNAPLSFGIQDVGGQFLQNFGAGMNPGANFLAGTGLNIAGGFAGGYLGNQAFGPTSGAGATVGGLAGTYLGMGNPLFTAAGSFLGAGAERVLGNVFGFGGDKGGNQAGRAVFDLGAGTGLTAYGVGNKFDEENVQGVQAVLNALKAFSDLVGGSSFSGTIKQGNRSGLKMDGRRYESAEDLLVEAFDTILDSADNLAGDIKELARAFDGTAQETMEYTQALLVVEDIITGSAADISEAARALMLGFEGTSEEMVRFSLALTGIYEMIQSNPVDQAAEDFAEAMRRAGMTMTEAYLDQLMGVGELIDAYDGSLESTEALANAMAHSRQMAYDLAIAIQAIGKEITAITEGEAEFYRTSQFNEDELRAYRTTQRDELMGQLGTSIDPNEIRALVTEISGLNREIFNSLSESERAAQAEDYAVRAEELGKLGEERLDAAMAVVEETQNLMIKSVDTMLANHVEGMQNTANVYARAVQLFAGVVQNLQLQGIRVNVNIPVGEVNG